MTNKHHYGRPLEVNIEKGALVIRIGIETLAHAVTYSDWANPYDEATGDYVRSFAIVDAPQFASDVAHEMLCEREDGSTPLSDFLDKMSEAALDNGSEGCEFDQCIKYGMTARIETWASDTGKSADCRAQPPLGDRDATCDWNCTKPYPHDGPCGQ